MKRYSVIVLVILLTLGCKTLKTEQNPFLWLLGKWERQGTRPGQSAFEEWTLDSHGTLRGTGITLRGMDTVFVEKLSLVRNDKGYHYTADVPGNPEPTKFQITSYDENGFVSENPEHDFPKKITYTKTESGIVATISGDGKKIDFVFKKVEQE